MLFFFSYIRNSVDKIRRECNAYNNKKKKVTSSIQMRVGFLIKHAFMSHAKIFFRFYYFFQ